MKILTFAIALVALTGLAVLDAPHAAAGGDCAPCVARASTTTLQPCATRTVQPCAAPAPVVVQPCAAPCAPCDPCAPKAQPVRYVQTRASCGPRLPRLPRLNIRWPWCCR